ncbi:MAG TPA: aminotransferase class I/II-fold pyridoxal phosphate-dependent enzyme [Thermomicrobiales bacterium]|nr:aminotransferase class I/II-fold pyridoxal phosphate-dependent enzyme [Thermomicrobiales bacterium]
MSITNPSAPGTEIDHEAGGAALQLPPDEMRTFGYAVVDSIVDHLASLREQPTARWADRPTMDARLWQSAPEHATDPREVLDRTVRDVLTDGHRNSHPRYFGYVPNPSNYVGAMADALASGFNIFSGMWMGSPGAAETELLVTDWMRDWCGLPDSGGGILLSGSSMANLVGIATARYARFGHDAEAARRGTIYYSDQAHSSVAKGARMIGVGLDRMRKVPSDDDFRLSMDSLAETVRSDRAAGLEPYCVIAAAGTTNTGAIDPLPELADFCAAEGIWLHADGAFGAAAVLSQNGKRWLAGLERVDSIALDAHKWLFQPIECGCLLVRDVRTLREAFYERPEYLRDADTADAEVNFSDMGPQLTREFRALKLWMSIQVFGMEAIRAAVERGIALAELAEREIRDAGIWEMITPAQISVLTFRYAPSNLTEQQINRLNARIAHATLEDGYAALSTTELRGKTVLRMCITNPRATEAEIRETVRRLGVYAADCLAEIG